MLQLVAVRDSSPPLMTTGAALTPPQALMGRLEGFMPPPMPPQDRCEVGRASHAHSLRAGSLTPALTGLALLCWCRTALALRLSGGLQLLGVTESSQAFMTTGLAPGVAGAGGGGRGEGGSEGWGRERRKDILIRYFTSKQTL